MDETLLTFYPCVPHASPTSDHFIILIMFGFGYKFKENTDNVIYARKEISPDINVEKTNLGS